MRGRHLFYCIILAGLCLPLVGCGGPQNPMEFGPSVPAFVDGWWDGITIFFAGFLELLQEKESGIYDIRQNNDYYDTGFFIGVAMFFWALYTAIAIFRS